MGVRTPVVVLAAGLRTADPAPSDHGQAPWVRSSRERRPRTSRRPRTANCVAAAVFAARPHRRPATLCRPQRSGRRRSARSPLPARPLTNVPLLEPRSCTIRLPPVSNTLACCRESWTSPPRLPMGPASRPSITPPSESWMVVPAAGPLITISARADARPFTSPIPLICLSSPTSHLVQESARTRATTRVLHAAARRPTPLTSEAGTSR